MKISSITIGLAIFALVIVSCQSPVSHLSATPTVLDRILPTPTTLMIPTASSTAIPEKVVGFTLNYANLIPPEDVLQEIDFYGGGGGGLSCIMGTYSQPTIILDPSDGELMTESTMITCGWQKQETLTGKIQYPDGRIISTAIPGDYLSFAPTLDAPPGLYIFRIIGKNETVESNAYFYKPNGPRLYEINPNRLMLYGFSPKENVRLLFYTFSSNKTLELKGWQHYTTNNEGRLIVDAVDKDLGAFVVIGEKSGEVHALLTSNGSGGRRMEGNVLLSSGIYDPFFKNNSYLVCAENTPTHFSSKGDSAKVASANLEVFANPRKSARVLAYLPIGANVYFFEGGGPYCDNGLIWWNVNYGATNPGFIIEFDNGQYNLEPSSNPNLFCGNLESRLSKGNRARVAFTDGTDMRIRAKPGVTQNVLYKVPEGTQFSVLEGPQCIDDIGWWKILTDDGLVGWVAEYQGSIYLLEPYQ